MGYFVVGDDGQKYGPADVATLNSWITEDRLVANSLLEDEATGVQFEAAAIPGMHFKADTAMPSYGSASQASAAHMAFGGGHTFGPSQGIRDPRIMLAIGLAILSPLLSFYMPIGGFITASGGLWAANKAKMSGNRLANAVIGLSFLAIAFWVITRIIVFTRVF